MGADHLGGTASTACHPHLNPDRRPEVRRLRGVLALTAAYMIAEVIGGWMANSLALLSDAGHMFTDVAALTLALVGFRLSARPHTPQKTYGYHRAEILAALLNGLALVVIALFIVREAIERFRDPPVVDASVLLTVATGGLLVNLVAYLLLHRVGGSLNARAALLHVIADGLGSVAAIVAGVAAAVWGFRLADPIASVAIATLVLFGAVKLVRGAVDILMEGTPARIDPVAVQRAMAAAEGVRAVHDLHIWTITSGIDALSAHVVVDDLAQSRPVLSALRLLAHTEFGIHHTTFQLEPVGFEESEPNWAHFREQSQR